VVFIHGGGFVIGEVDGYEYLVRDLARRMRIVTISVGYRLAPEYPFPTPIDDCELVVKELLTLAYNRFHVDKDRVLLMGDSAGGNIVAVLTQRLARYRQIASDNADKEVQSIEPALPKIKAQVLIYPLLQYHDMLLPSYQAYHKEYSGTSFLDAASIARWLLMYLNVDASPDIVASVLVNNHTGSFVLPKLHHRLDHTRLPERFTNVPSYNGRQDVPVGDLRVYSMLAKHLDNPEFAPLFGNLNDLPQAMIATCEYDVLRDEGYLYAAALREHNTSVSYHHYDGGFHAMLNFHKEVPLAQQLLDDIRQYVHDVL